MRILLVGEYSNVHWTLAEGLRALGHSVTVVSDGDGWKDYPRDIDLSRHDLSASSPLRRATGTIRYLFNVARVWPQLRGYDIVQLINPVFLDLKAERIWPFYRYLRRHNGRIFLGAFGIDYYWVLAGMDCNTFRYSDFNFGSNLRDYPFMHEMVRDWLHGPKGILNRRIADDCDGIITGLYEYEASYRPHYPDKTRFIPFPINLSTVSKTTLYPFSSTQSSPTPPHPISVTTPPSQLLPEVSGEAHICAPLPPIRAFIGIQRSRSAYKGTDIMLSALRRLKADFGPERLEVITAENIPFAQYQNLMNTSHVILDQLYSYTPAMNALLAMAKGLIVVGGGEPEHYDLLGEHELRPIINVQPNEQDVYNQIANQLLSHPESIQQLQLDSIKYICRHHDHIAVARQYENFYNS